MWNILSLNSSDLTIIIYRCYLLEVQSRKFFTNRSMCSNTKLFKTNPRCSSASDPTISIIRIYYLIVTSVESKKISSSLDQRLTPSQFHKFSICFFQDHLSRFRLFTDIISKKLTIFKTYHPSHYENFIISMKHITLHCNLKGETKF